MVRHEESPIVANRMAFVILLYHLIENWRERIIERLLRQIPKTCRSFSKMPRNDLREYVRLLLDGYLELLIHNKSVRLEKNLSILAKYQFSRGFPVTDATRALTQLFAPIRQVLQVEFREADGDGKQLFEQAMKAVDDANCETVTLWAQAVYNYLRDSKREPTLEKSKAQAAIDLSKLIIFRA